MTSPSLVECSHCHELKASHAICKKCGYYNGEQKIVVEKEKKEA